MLRKNILLSGFISLLFAFSCSKPAVKQSESSVVEKDERILAEVMKMDIPRIEKNSNRVKVLIWGKRPDLKYAKEEPEISKSDTGYTVKIWLSRLDHPAASYDIYREVEFQIPSVGGHDIEVVGRSESFIKIVYIEK